jgi:transposase
MPAERLSMRKVREVLRLRHVLGLSYREIAIAAGVGHTAAAEYVHRAKVIGITWPVPGGVDDAMLDARLFGHAGRQPGMRPGNDKGIGSAIGWPKVQTELKRRGVTLLLLWQEYREAHPDGYGYSRYCDLYCDWKKRINPTMRQVHRAGEKLFVDWAGDTVPVFDPTTGTVRQAHIFVAALGASNFTYAEARWSETLPDWTAAHVNALDAIGGVPAALVPDNLKAGITMPSRYEPGINRTYQDLADHYDCVVMPTRIIKPQDKAKVEVAVQIVERFVLAKLRNRSFLSLAGLNGAIKECVATINAKVMRAYGQSRAALFETIDRPALKPLPYEPYAYATWQRARVGQDYHVTVDGHAYSVPSKLVGERVDCRLTTATVEVLHGGKRVASHPVSRQQGGATTNQDHMPPSHRAFAEWTPDKLQAEAALIGPATAELVAAVFAAKRHPEQGCKACLGILSLVKSYGRERVEAACRRGLAIKATTFGSIQSILRHGLDAVPVTAAVSAAPILHSQIRGGRYFH